MASEDNGQVLQYNVTSTSITIPSTSIDLNGMLSAVSVCGDESEPVSFEGTIIVTCPIKEYTQCPVLSVIIINAKKNYSLRFEKIIFNCCQTEHAQ